MQPDAMLRLALFTGLLLALSLARADDDARPADSELVRQGRHLILIGGCNDCHTASFAPSGGKTPESEWLTGSPLGFSGGWGTTYPTNLRTKLATMDLVTWKAYAHTLSTRPPMPYWALNEMSDIELEAIWTYVRSLGPAGPEAPSALPPGQQANGPVVRFPAPPPEPNGRH